MKSAIILVLLGALWWTGDFVLDFRKDIQRHENALAGKVFLLPPTDEEVKRYEILEKELEIRQKQEELAQIKDGKSSDSEASFNLTIKHTDEIIALYDTYPPGHNPPVQVIQDKIHELISKRNLYGMGFGFTTAVLLVFIFLPKRKGDS